MSDKRSMKERGKDAAAAYLERVGICVFERDYEHGSATVDVIAWEGDTLAFVDVAVRRTADKRTLNGVSKSRLGRMRRAAKGYIQQAGLPQPQVRFDAIDILVIAEDRALLRHHRAAF